MLEIVIPEREWWDETAEEFISTKETKLTLEHSLVSISKWESHFKKPFLTKDNKTLDETLYYVKCMTITQNVDPRVYRFITASQLKEIEDYVQDPMTATWFREEKQSPSREIITSELIYYWMVAAGVPLECQKWHLNRLLTLLKICSIKNQPSKKRGLNDIYRSNSALNAARRKRMGTRG